VFSRPSSTGVSVTVAILLVGVAVGSIRVGSTPVSVCSRSRVRRS
jgi:hypothetical protein